jgi:hypothetical protein
LVERANESLSRRAALLGLEDDQKARQEEVDPLISDICGWYSIEGSTASKSSFFFFLLFGEGADLNDVCGVQWGRNDWDEKKPFFSMERQRRSSPLSHFATPRDLLQLREKPSHPSLDPSGAVQRKFKKIIGSIALVESLSSSHLMSE